MHFSWTQKREMPRTIAHLVAIVALVLGSIAWAVARKFPIEWLIQREQFENPATTASASMHTRLTNPTGARQCRSVCVPRAKEREVYRAFVSVNGVPPTEVSLRHYSTLKYATFEDLVKILRSDFAEEDE